MSRGFEIRTFCTVIAGIISGQRSHNRRPISKPRDAAGTHSIDKTKAWKIFIKSFDGTRATWRRINKQKEIGFGNNIRCIKTPQIYDNIFGYFNLNPTIDLTQLEASGKRMTLEKTIDISHSSVHTHTHTHTHTHIYEKKTIFWNLHESKYIQVESAWDTHRKINDNCWCSRETGIAKIHANKQESKLKHVSRRREIRVWWTEIGGSKIHCRSDRRRVFATCVYDLLLVAPDDDEIASCLMHEKNVRFTNINVPGWLS